jgi:hypothetical protein
MTTPFDPLFAAGMLPGLLVALAQHGPGFRTAAFLACWGAASALGAYRASLASR